MAPTTNVDNPFLTFSDATSAVEATEPLAPDFDPRALDQLIELVRIPAGRSAAVSAGTLLAVLRRLSSVPTHLLPRYLFLVRNLVVGDLFHQNQFVACGGADRVASILVRSPPVPVETVRAALLVLGNVALGGEPHQADVWARFFPHWFCEMAAMQQLCVMDPLCFVVDCCCSGEEGSRRIAELCDPDRGLKILLEIIATACHAGYKEVWVEWLLCKAFVEEPYFTTVFPKLTMNDPTKGSISPQQVFLLRTLEKFMSTHPQDVGRISRDFSLTILKILREVSVMVDLTASKKLPTDGLALNVLECSLNTLKTICSLDNSLPENVDGPVKYLLADGLLDDVLGLLQELEPTSTAKKSLANSGGQAMQPSVGKKVCPYKGYRRDLVSVIANCVHRRKQVQDEIRQRGAIPLLMQQCVNDDDNPFLKDRSMVAIRYLLEGNLENQNEVAELELREPVKVEIDEKSQRPRFVNIQ